MRSANSIRADLLRTEACITALEAQDSLTASETSELRALQGKIEDLGLELADTLDGESHVSPDGAAIEHAALLARANAEGGIGAVVAALSTGSETSGAVKELQQAHGVPSSSVPLDMLRGPQMAVTPGVQTGVDERQTVQPIFAEGDLAFFNIPMDTVPSGDAAYPVLTSRPTVGGPHTDSTTVAETTGAFKVSTLQPERSQCSFFYRRSDAVRFSGMGEALREALVMAISENEDKLFISQLQQAANAGGLGAAVDVHSGQPDFGQFQAVASGAVDGRHAKMKTDVKMLVGAASYAAMDASYQSNGDESALAVLQRTAGGVRVTPHLSAVSSKKQDLIVRKGMARDFACAMWNAVYLIFDEISKASTGEIQITAVTMSNRALLRSDGFARRAVQVQA